MISMRFEQFYRKFITRQWARFRSPVVVKVEDYYLPRACAIHFVPETNHEFGIDTTHSLMRNIGKFTLMYHITDLNPTHGKVRKVPTNPEMLMRNYHKRYREFIRVKNLDKSLINDRLHMVVNYSLLPHYNIQMHHPLAIYQEWQNMRDCMWNNIKELGTARYHIIPYKIPTYIPDKASFLRFYEEMTITGLKQFHEKDTFDFLELWAIVKAASEGKPFRLPQEIVDKTILVFIESNKVVTIQLKDLLLWAAEEKNMVMNVLYQFMDFLLSLRTPVDTGEIVAEVVKSKEEVKLVEESSLDEETEIVDNAKLSKTTTPEEKMSSEDIDKMLMEQATHIEELLQEEMLETPVIAKNVIEEKIQERALAGTLSTAEQKGLVKLSEKWKTIPNPFNPKETLADVTITPEDTILSEEPVVDSSISIHDDSLTKSRLQNFDKQYVQKVMKKDILNTVMSLQNGGLLVKNIKATEKNTVATRNTEISVQVQPVAGTVSTIKFKIPTVKEDGTFLANGVNYRMDKLRGDLPIVKIKSHTVGLTS